MAKWHLIAYPRKGTAFRVATFDTYAEAMNAMQKVAGAFYVIDTAHANGELCSILYPLCGIDCLVVVERECWNMEESE